MFSETEIYRHYLSILDQNRLAYEKIRDKALSQKNDNIRADLISLTVAYANNFFIGQYVDEVLENELLKIANKVDSNLKKHKDKTCLHVFTEVKFVGGHSRVIYNWIKQNKKIGYQNGIYLLNQNVECLPDFFLEGLVSEDNIHVAKERTIVERSIKLREIASSYEYVVLHTHMNDVVPMIAFGTDKFTRPIIYFNHADHLFWLGVSISDCVADLSASGQKFSQIYRGVSNSFILPIPLEKQTFLQKGSLPEKLVPLLNKSSKLIVSMAAPYKYKCNEFLCFPSFVEEVLSDNPDVIVLIIGPSPSDEAWKVISKKHRKRLILSGYLNKYDVRKVIEITDVYIDSFPFSSYTSYLEFAVEGIPSFTLSHKETTLDVMKVPGVSFAEVELLKSALNDLLSGEVCWGNSLQHEIEKTHVIGKGWDQNLKSLYSNCNENHSLRKIKPILKDHDLKNIIRTLKGQEETLTLVKEFKSLSLSKLYFLGLLIKVNPRVFIVMFRNVFRYMLRKRKE
jgi:hypothetical protein